MSLIALKQNVSNRRHVIFACFLSLYLTLGLYFLQYYIPWRSASFLMAVGGLPLVIAGSVSGGHSYRFLFAGIIAGLASFFIPAQTVLFISFTLLCLGLAELFYGRISAIPLLVVLLLSPLSYAITIFGFPVRLWLTGIAADILRFTGSGVVASGNVITYAGSDFTVDPACMGLKMLATSLWLSLYMLHFTQKAQRRKMTLLAIILILLLVFCFNIVTNLVRIVLLVYFDVPASNGMHDVIGLCCFAVYTLLPLMLLLRWLVKKLGKPLNVAGDNAGVSWSKLWLIPALGSIALLLAAYNTAKAPTGISLAPHPVTGYVSDLYNRDIIRLRSDNALIYVKKAPAFYSSEHSPLLCWVGSGYEFEQLRQTTVDGVSIYTGTLTNRNDVLYTAWWYDNGQNRTISQIAWRLDMLTGKAPYCVVNITCNTSAELTKEVASLLSTGKLNAVIRE